MHFKKLLGVYKVNIVDIKLDELKPYENNPRNNEEAVEPVAKSIKEFGFKVPYIVVDDLTEDQVISHNFP